MALWSRKLGHCDSKILPSFCLCLLPISSVPGTPSTPVWDSPRAVHYVFFTFSLLPSTSSSPRSPDPPRDPPRPQAQPCPKYLISPSPTFISGSDCWLFNAPMNERLLRTAAWRKLGFRWSARFKSSMRAWAVPAAGAPDLQRLLDVQRGSRCEERVGRERVASAMQCCVASRASIPSAGGA
ncbi:hypothetical protein C8R47DRAFT_639376 [Mycena vitilis]|nr:hypothetical protein C8R47DRAFT_639376 [Mycena vitilis]